MKIAIFIIMLLLIGAFFIVSQNNLALKEPENIDKFTEKYVSWLGRIFDNAAGLTGYVLKLEWLPEEQD